MGIMSYKYKSQLQNDKIIGSNSYSIFNGLKGYWSFDGNIVDLLELNNATLHGNPQITIGKDGNGYSLDGNNDFLSIPKEYFEFDSGSELTINIWIKCDGTSTGIGTNVYLGAWLDSGMSGWGIYDNGAWYMGDSVSWYAKSANISIDNDWHMYTLTHDGEYMKIYKDGSFLSEEGPFTPIYNISNYISIGNDNRSGLQNRFRKESVDEFGIWNRSLNNTEIQNLYSLTLPSKNIIINYPLDYGLKGYWTFDNNVADYTENGNSGTINGNPILVNGIISKCYQTDSVDDYISIPKDNFEFEDGSEISINLWIKTDTETGLTYYLGAWSNTNYIGYGIADTSWYMGDGSMWYTVNHGILEDNNWHMYTLTYDGYKMISYRDGELLDNTHNIGNETFIAKYLIDNFITIGADNRDTSRNRNASFDEFGIWKRCLTDSDIEILYNHGKGHTFTDFKSNIYSTVGLEKGLKHYYSLDQIDKDSNIIFDIISRNNGTILASNGEPNLNFENGIVKKSKTFDTNTYIQLDEEITLSKDSATIAFWAYTNDGSTYYEDAVVGWNNNFAKAIYYVNGLLIGETNTNNDGFTWNGDYNIHEWNHFVASFDNGSATTYVNGQLLQNSIPIVDDLNITQIGRMGTRTPLNGGVDELYIWDKVINPEEVRVLYNNGKGIAYSSLSKLSEKKLYGVLGDLVQHWSFESNGNNSILTGQDLNPAFYVGNTSTTGTLTGTRAYGDGVSCNTSTNRLNPTNVNLNPINIKKGLTINHWFWISDQYDVNYSGDLIFQGDTISTKLFITYKDNRVWLRCDTPEANNVTLSNTYFNWGELNMHTTILDIENQLLYSYINGSYNSQRIYGGTMDFSNNFILDTNYRVYAQYRTLDEVSIWNRQLDADTIKNLYNNGKAIPFKNWLY